MIDRFRRIQVVATTTVATAVLATATAAHAQDRGNPRFQDILLHDRFDADENGRLDRTERDLAREEAAAKPQRRRRGGPPGGRSGQEMPRPETRADAIRIDPDDIDAVPRLENTGLYDRDVLHTIFLQFPEDDWHQEMVAFHGTDIEVPATMLLDGRPIGEVGVSYRGNTSFDMPAKKSFGISIDAYDDDLRIDGHRTLNLLNANGDASLMREVLFSNIAGEYVPAPKANFVRVVVNGFHLGVYANVEQINKDFTKTHHGTRKGVRWKVPPDFSGGGALAYHGPDHADYTGRYELKTGSAGEADWDALIELCRVLRETPEDELEETLPRHLDVKETIRFLAIDNALLDSDGYYSRGSDYYIYLDPEGVFHLVHYDNNETFGGGRGGGPGGPGGPPPNFGPDGPPPGFERGGGRERGARGGQDARRGERRGRGRGPGRGGPGRGGQGGGMTQAPLAFADDPGTRPVIARILAVPAWRAEYLETLREIAEVQLAWNTLGPRVDAYRELIEADVIRDPFLGDRTAFLRSLYGDDQSLKSLAAERRRFLLGHADLTPAAPEPE
jgi:spore coat protein CotH